MQVTCTGCWSRFPAGTVFCRQCKLPVGAQRILSGQHETQVYKPTVPPIVATTRGFLLFMVLCNVVPLIVAAESPRAASWLGPGLLGRSIDVHGLAGTGLVMAFAVGGLIGWGALAMVAHWYMGRVVLFGLIGLGTLCQVVVLHIDVAQPINDLSLLGSGLAIAVLGYATVQPA